MLLYQFAGGKYINFHNLTWVDKRDVDHGTPGSITLYFNGGPPLRIDSDEPLYLRIVQALAAAKMPGIVGE